uniref:Uncharacterized protein n=1 Tax=Oryza nivara TaxID=4536 RepID=A0A0E0G6J2_ORYNI
MGDPDLIRMWTKIWQPNPNPKIISPIPFLSLQWRRRRFGRSDGGGDDSGGATMIPTSGNSAKSLPFSREKRRWRQFRRAAMARSVKPRLSEPLGYRAAN